jgi:hypothetical protein
MVTFLSRIYLLLCFKSLTLKHLLVLFIFEVVKHDRRCGLVVRLPGCRPKSPEFDSPALPDFLSSSGSGTESTQPL